MRPVTNVGTGESVVQALRSTRPGGMVGWGAPHGVEVGMRDTFWRSLGVRGGPAPVRNYLSDLVNRVWTRQIHQLAASAMPKPRAAAAVPTISMPNPLRAAATKR